MPRAASISTLLLVATAAGASAPTPVPAEPKSPTIGDLTFMAGCWEGSFSNGGVIEEHYTAPSANLILGTTRYNRAGRTVEFEFTHIAQTDSGVILTARPNGGPGVPFRLVWLEGRSARFENPTHDFPKRIAYRSPHADTLVARIDAGSDTKPREWRMARAACS